MTWQSFRWGTVVAAGITVSGALVWNNHYSQGRNFIQTFLATQESCGVTRYISNTFPLYDTEDTNVAWTTLDVPMKEPVYVSSPMAGYNMIGSYKTNYHTMGWYSGAVYRVDPVYLGDLFRTDSGDDFVWNGWTNVAISTYNNVADGNYMLVKRKHYVIKNWYSLLFPIDYNTFEAYTYVYTNTDEAGWFLLDFGQSTGRGYDWNSFYTNTTPTFTRYDRLEGYESVDMPSALIIPTANLPDLDGDEIGLGFFVAGAICTRNNHFGSADSWKYGWATHITDVQLSNFDEDKVRLASRYENWFGDYVQTEPFGSSLFGNYYKQPVANALTHYSDYDLYDAMSSKLLKLMDGALVSPSTTNWSSYYLDPSFASGSTYNPLNDDSFKTVAMVRSNKFKELDIGKCSGTIYGYMFNDQKVFGGTFSVTNRYITSTNLQERYIAVSELKHTLHDDWRGMVNVNYDDDITNFINGSLGWQNIANTNTDGSATCYKNKTWPGTNTYDKAVQNAIDNYETQTFESKLQTLVASNSLAVQPDVDMAWFATFDMNSWMVKGTASRGAEDNNITWHYYGLFEEIGDEFDVFGRVSGAVEAPEWTDLGSSQSKYVNLADEDEMIITSPSIGDGSVPGSGDFPSKAEVEANGGGYNKGADMVNTFTTPYGARYGLITWDWTPPQAYNEYTRTGYSFDSFGDAYSLMADNVHRVYMYRGDDLITFNFYSIYSKETNGGQDYFYANSVVNETQFAVRGMDTNLTKTVDFYVYGRSIAQGNPIGDFPADDIQLDFNGLLTEGEWTLIESVSAGHANCATTTVTFGDVDTIPTMPSEPSAGNLNIRGFAIEKRDIKAVIRWDFEYGDR